MNGNEYDGLDFGESCDYDVHERNERLTAENAKLRAELAEAQRIMMATRVIMNDFSSDGLIVDEDMNILRSLNKFVDNGSE